jgi:hypothetical protein
VEDEGRVLIYEGHDTPKRKGAPDPKTVDQPTHTPGGKLTQNGLFLEAVGRYKRHESEPELVKVYDKIRPGIWVYCGVFELIDAWQELSIRGKYSNFNSSSQMRKQGPQDQK